MASPAAAARTLSNVLALAPGNCDAIRLMGIAAQNCGNHHEASECFRRALVASPDDADLHIGLGVAQYQIGAVDDALAHLKRACELAPNSASAWYNFAEALKLQVRTHEAMQALQRTLALDSRHVPARISLARAQTSLGQIENAETCLRELLRYEPCNAEAWLALSNLKTVALRVEDVRSMEDALSREDLPPGARIQIGFALAKALEDQGDYARAFDVLEQANSEQRGRGKWNASGERARVNAIMRAFAGVLPQPIDLSLGSEVILIASIPRSGSTLVEQILASHTEVAGANEIKDLPNLIEAETRRRGIGFPLWAPEATGEDWQRLGAKYLEQTLRWRERHRRFTDKNLLNWMLAGPAMTMLPGARVVVCRRDPLETCLGCYRQYFDSTAAGFAYDLDDMADYCIDFMRLTRFWLEKFPDRVFDLQYERLLAEPEITIRRLLDFCGLPFEAACLEFHKTSRTVLSAPSAAQVRQPLRRDTARAARYGDKLDHLRNRLRNAGVLPEGK